MSAWLPDGVAMRGWLIGCAALALVLFSTDAFAATTRESAGYRYYARQTSTASLHNNAAYNVPFIGIGHSW
ncbi:MAG TPA: hypothetical protein PLE54_09480 [Burkholderiaceae bacterium]|nr:hypothetical protein [Burkholderiaceae bacterium]